MEKVQEKIAELLNETPALPALFVGSGLSRRYLGLPDWEGLLKHFAAYLDKPYSYYYNKAQLSEDNDPALLLPQVADYIEQDFNEIWFVDDKFKDQRQKYQEEIESNVSPFKIAVADFLGSKSKDIVHAYDKEIASFKKITEKNISCIITTNYDLFFEKTLGDSFQKYVGQNELMFSNLVELAELYKIHGCCTKPETLVIDKKDYKEFIDKQKYLSAKLLTIFLEHPVIFIGYSLTDLNIRRILESITECLEDEQLSQLKKRLIFIEWNNTDGPDAIRERVFTFNNGKSIAMQSFSLKDYSILYKAILSNHVKYEVRTLRRIKEELYQLVTYNKPTEKLYVATNLEDNDQDVEFVVGVGVYGKFGDTGYVGLNLNQLYRYVLRIGDKTLRADLILRDTIPNLYNGSTKLPVCGLITQCSDEKFISDRALKTLKQQKSLDDFRTEGQKKRVKNSGYKHIYTSLLKYYESHNLSQTLAAIPILDPDEIDADDLYQLLVRAAEDDKTLLNEDKKIDNPQNSGMRKCISIWDWLKYHKSAEQRINHLRGKN